MEAVTKFNQLQKLLEKSYLTFFLCNYDNSDMSKFYYRVKQVGQNTR